LGLVKKGLSDSKYYLIANMGNKLFAFLIIPILAKNIPIEEFAIYDIFLLVTLFLNILVILGIDSGIGILLTESQNNKSVISFLYVSSLLISFLVILALSLMLYIIFHFTNELFLLKKDIWIYVCFYSLFSMINNQTFNFFRWQQKAKEASLISLFSYLSGMFIGLFFFFYFGKNIERYLQGLTVGISLGSIASLYLARKYILSFKIVDNAKELLKELLILSLPYVPNYLGNSLMQMVDRLVIMFLFGKYELGLYAIVTKVAKIPKIIIDTLSGGFFPIMFKNYKTPNGQKLIRSFFHIYLIAIPILFIITYPISSWIIGIFGGEKYLSVSYMLPMALVSILFVGGTKLNGLGYPIKRKTYYVLYITFLSILLNFIFSLLFGYFLGLAGIIVGTLTAGIIKIFIYTYYSEKLYKFNYSFKLMAFVSLLSLAFVITASL